MTSQIDPQKSSDAQHVAQAATKAANAAAAEASHINADHDATSNLINHLPSLQSTDAESAQPTYPSSPSSNLARNPSGTPATGAKRKRTSTATTASSNRGVAHLTPEQLERKRANDREAQRAIRERTKNHIDRLNREIETLKNSNPYKELQAVIKSREAVEAENRELKRRIAEFLGGVKSYLEIGDGGPDHGDHGSGPAGHGGQGLNDLAAAAINSNVNAPGGGMPVTPYGFSAYGHHTSIEAASPASLQTIGSPGSVSSTNRHYPYSGGTSWTTNGYEPGTENIQPDLAGALPASDERLGLNYLLQRGSQVAMTDPSTPPIRPLWSCLPINSAASCPLDTILLNFLAERRQMAQDPVVTKDILIGPDMPNFNAIINKQTPHPSHPMSKIMTDILYTFPDLSNLPQKCAVVYIMWIYCRWLVAPTKEHFDSLPDWIRPTDTQRNRAHPHWFDYLPWPALRDFAASEDQFQPFSEFFVPYTKTLSLNWPYDPQDVLVPRAIPAHEIGAHGMPMEEPKYSISPIFLSHLRNLGNWSLGEAFVEEVPRWASQVRILKGSSNRR